MSRTSLVAGNRLFTEKKMNIKNKMWIISKKVGKDPLIIGYKKEMDIG
jgi:hypothetical protein